MHEHHANLGDITFLDYSFWNPPASMITKKRETFLSCNDKRNILMVLFNTQTHSLERWWALEMFNPRDWDNPWKRLFGQEFFKCYVILLSCLSVLFFSFCMYFQGVIIELAIRGYWVVSSCIFPSASKDNTMHYSYRTNYFCGQSNNKYDNLLGLKSHE